MKQIKKHCGRTYRCFLRLLLVLVACASFACAPKNTNTSSYPAGKKNERTTVQVFTPWTKEGVVAISQQEAMELVRKMRVGDQGLKRWSDMSFAVQQSLDVASKKKPGDIAVQRYGVKFTYGQLSLSLKHLLDILPDLDSHPERLAKEFTWYRLGPDFGFTGYYEPTLLASRKRTARYHYPLYRLPSDIRKGVPYHSRNQIDRKGSLQGRGLEVAWVESEIDAFFLHIQGSGRLLFEDKSVVHVLYAGKNNHAYKALGGIMRDHGLLEPNNISMKTIKAKLATLPASQQAALLDKNPSYIFFREASKGPVGGMGRPLTPWVSIATDRSVLPYGTLTFVSLPLPDAKGNFTQPFFGLTLPQDTGGAIRGNRIDLFGGPSPQAEHTAGFLDTKGAVYILIKK